ncbi:hypothetical protein H0S70_13065 [Chryseobacterium manosquense]|uniref:GTPase domain-containing protein n=1 Tax=Chryseobacterium manosquense TaxID=2754694 RepID=A0A7H1DW82_9FLAO|nr:hypothetical protein [Chryseobacterium manosquense]QNS41240.1 hypothetical protein H0S70_13065 [Chryseobacterium manosquense]
MPLLPLIWIISILTGGVAIFLASRKFAENIKNLFKDPNRNKLGILGMQGSGKTLYLCHLRKVEYEEKNTDLHTPYSEFTYETNSGKIIHIEAGEDISGIDYNRMFYISIMEKSDVIFYFFDISRYFTELDYERECNSRFLYLFDYFEKNKTKKLIVFASHLDKCQEKKGTIPGKFRNMLKNKTYNKLLEKTHFINLTSEKELIEITNLIFEKK